MPAMPDPMDPEFTAQNPIVEAATRLRARRELAAAIDATAGEAAAARFDDAQAALRAFGDQLALGCRRLGAILGSGSVKFIRLERPLRLRLRFADERVSLELDDVHQLVRITGMGLDGDYQFDPAADVPSLINISQLSTEAAYGQRLTPSSLLKHVARDAELPRPPHLGASGPLQF